MSTVEKLFVQIFERKNSIIEQVRQQTELYCQHLASIALIDGITPPSWLWNPNTSDSEELNKEELISKLLRPYPQPSARWSFANYPGYNNIIITRNNEEFCDRVSVENPAFSKGPIRQDDPTVPALSTDDHAGCALNSAPEPYPQPSPCWSFANHPGYNNIIIRGDNEECCDISVENPAFSKSLKRQDDPTVPALSTDDPAGCALDSAPETDASVTSPEDQTDERILNIYNAPDQSLAGIQRSKSRQKALELRSSAKALAKSGLRRENISDLVSSQIRFSLSATNQAGLNDGLPQLAESSVVGGRSYEDRDLDKTDRISREIGMDAYSDRMTRSRTYAEVPISVTGSFTLGFSSEDCQENAFSHDAKARRKESMPIFNSEHANNYVNKLPKSAGPSTVFCLGCRDRRVGDADFLSKDKETNVSTVNVTTSEISGERQGCGCGSSKAGSSDNYQGIDIAMMDSGDDLHPVRVDGSLVKVNLPTVHSEDCDARESISGDHKRHEERGTSPSRSSIQRNACVEEVCDLEVSSFSAKVDGGIFAPSSAVSARQVNDSHEVSRFVKPSVGLFRRLTRSQTRSNDKETYHSVAYNENTSFRCTISKSDSKKKSAAEELQKTSNFQSAPACYGTHSTLHDGKNGSLVMVSELVSHDHVDLSCSSSSSYLTKQRRELESQVSPSPSDSFAFVEPKQFDCKEIEKYNLKAFISESGKQRLDNSPEKISYSLYIPDVSLDKVICGGANQLSLGKQSPEVSDVSSKGDKTHRDSFESDVQENPDTHAENLGRPVMSNTMLKAPEYDTEAGLNCEISEVHHEADNMLSKIVNMPDIEIHPVKLHTEHGRESSPVRHMEEGDWSSEDKDKGQLVSSVPERKNSRLSHCHSSANEPRAESHGCLIKKVEMTNPIVLDEIKQFPAQQSQNLSCLEGEVCTQYVDSSLGDSVLRTHSTVRLHGENSSLERRLRYMSMGSWPQIKRRKFEHQQAHSLTNSPSLPVKKPQSIPRGPANTYLKTMEINVDTAFMKDVNKSTDVGICAEMNSSLMEGIESSFLSQHGEVGSCYKEKNEHKDSSSDISDKQLDATLVSSLTMKESRNSQGCFLEEIRTSLSSSNLFDARISGNEQCSEPLCNLEKSADNLNSESLKLSNTLPEGIQSPKWEGGLHTQRSALSPSNEYLQLTDADQSMPVFEGFIVDAQTDSGELNFAADAFDLDELNLPRTTLERASILAEICRSASLDGPSCQFSSAFEFQETQNLVQSVPNGGHLEHLDLVDTYHLNSDVGKHLQSDSSSSDDYKDAIDGMPYSVSLAYSSARYGWNSRNQYPSPVGNLWDRLSSHSGSSEKRLSSNPELTCFPIEEDPSISEESKTVDENAGDVEEEIDSSLANHCDKRQPLKDLTNLSLNMSVSAEEETLKADSVDFVSRKFSVTGTQEKVQLGPKYQYRNKSEISEKQTSSTGTTDGRKNQPSSIGANGIKKVKESMNNSISKPIVSNKTSLKGQNQKLSLKEPTRNNIVSNVSSFIPLIQQKQATIACAGKRDVKVKALEAAEAAKRLEEKKENERKLRKEALKLERAKLEEKNLRHMELEKKKKEEERKKKDADIIAKKRLREEEEKKEKEKKRMRLEARQRQREQEEKKRAEKAEKENQRSKDEQMNTKKEFHNEPKKQQNREITKGDGVALQKAETKLTLAGVVTNYEECGTAGLSCEAEKAMHTVDKSPRNEDLIAQNGQGKSYEISPYQCSDDEHEEDDELPTKKYIPSWASKSSVALFLPLQQKLDPEVIFPPESFCSMDEVLLPRKLQQNQVAA